MILDIIALAVILFIIIAGIKKGLVKTFFSATSFIIAIALTAITLSPAVKYLENTGVGEYIYEKTELSLINEEDGSKYLECLEIFIDTETLVSEIGQLQTDLSAVVGSFIIKVICAIVLFIVYSIMMKLLSKMLDAIFKLPFLEQLNKVGGFLIGCINAYIFMNIFACILMLLISTSLGSVLKSQLETSYIVSWFCCNNLLI